MTSPRLVTRKSLIPIFMAGLLTIAFMAPAMANNGNGNGGGNNNSYECQDAGDTGMTAVFVNQSVVNESIDFADHDCDLAIYFDESAPPNAIVRNSIVKQTPEDGGSGSGLWNAGGDVTVTNSTFLTDVTGQYVPIRFDHGATGRITGNSISGSHRVGVVVRGEETSAQILRNSISGTGAKTSGWAENGIQVDEGATVSISNNLIQGHWWGGASNWASSGIMLLSDNSSITNNTLIDNEFSVYVVGSGNRVAGNRVVSEVSSGATPAFVAWGILVSGSDNHLAGNQLSSDGGGAGVYVFDDSHDNQVTGNRISGFASAVSDAGTETMIRGKPID